MPALQCGAEPPPYLSTHTETTGLDCFPPFYSAPRLVNPYIWILGGNGGKETSTQRRDFCNEGLKMPILHCFSAIVNVLSYQMGHPSALPISSDHTLCDSVLYLFRIWVGGGSRQQGGPNLLLLAEGPRFNPWHLLLKGSGVRGQGRPWRTTASQRREGTGQDEETACSGIWKFVALQGETVVQ